jgi:hypothetical protein
VLATVVGIAGGLFTLYDHMTRPRLDLELLRLYQGWEIRIRNTGRALARQVRLSIVSWQHGGPAPEVRESHAIHELVPGADIILHIDVRLGSAKRDDVEYIEYLQNVSISGYLLATCEGCSRPRARAFYVPGNNDDQKSHHFFPWRDGVWPTAEFNYPTKLPFVSDCVDHPKGVCADEHHPRWTPDTGPSRKNGVPAWPE